MGKRVRNRPESVHHLVNLAKDGELSDAEVDRVAERLRTEPVGESTYWMLYVVARTFATRHRALVESFLDCRENPDVAHLAEQTLRVYWDGL